MSRFFELLNETVRSDGNRSANPAAPDPPPRPVSRSGKPGALADIEQALSASIPAATQAPVLDPLYGSGAIPDADGIPANEAAITVHRQARLIPQALDPAAMEHYRKLRTNILQQQKMKSFRTLLVTSPNPQEGKTLTVLNLGLIFAMVPSFKVLVLDGDLRRGSFAKMLGIRGRRGFSNLIDGSAQLEDVILKSDEFPLHFVVSGTSSVSPGELLQSDELPKQLRRMSNKFSLVLVDSPPVNVLTDAPLLAGNCDAVLLVARAFRSKRKSLEKAVQDLAPFRVIGTVLNGGAPPVLYGSYSRYY